MPKNPTEVATVILAGGQGTRLHPLTINHCKPAVCYGGRYRLIDIPISNSINSDFRHIYVIAQYLSAELQQYVTQTYPFDPFSKGSIEVLTPHENKEGEKEWFKGTADAVRKNLSTILQSPAKYFLILSGDQLYNMNFKEMVSFAEKTDSDLTIASIPVELKETSRMGILRLDTKGKVTDFIEKPKTEAEIKPFSLSSGKYLGSMGIYIFKREALVRLLQEDTRDDFGYHLIHTAVQQNKTYSFVYKGYWEDIGTVASFYEANLLLTQASGGLNTYDEANPIYARPTFLPGARIKNSKINQSIICEGCTIESAEISHSIIGLRTKIGELTRIYDSILMGNQSYSGPLTEEFSIGKNCLIKKVIIDENVRIGNFVELTNSENLTRYEGDGIFIRDGIIIVTSGTTIPDYFKL